MRFSLKKGDHELFATIQNKRICKFFDNYDEAFIGLNEYPIKTLMELSCTQSTNWCLVGAANGNPAYQKMVEEGQLAHYEREIKFLNDNFEDWM